MDGPSSLSSNTNLTWASIVLAFSFIALGIIISIVLGLKIGASLATAAARCVFQLALLALVLESVYDAHDPWVVAGLACALLDMMRNGT